MAFHMFFMTCPIQPQWEKWIENGIIDFLNDFLNDYNKIKVTYMFWHCGGNKIFDY